MAEKSYSTDREIMVAGAGSWLIVYLTTHRKQKGRAGSRGDSTCSKSIPSEVFPPARLLL